MAATRQHNDATEPNGDSPGTNANPTPAWEMIENGRYRPRRIRGSCLGRELG